MAKICIFLCVFSLPGPFNATTAHCVVCEERVRCTEVTCPKEYHHCPCHTSSRCSLLNHLSWMSRWPKQVKKKCVEPSWIDFLHGYGLTKRLNSKNLGFLRTRDHRDLWGYSNPLLCKMMDQERTRFGGFFTGFEPKTCIEKKQKTTTKNNLAVVQPEECLCST